MLEKEREVCGLKKLANGIKESGWMVEYKGDRFGRKTCTIWWTLTEYIK